MLGSKGVLRTQREETRDAAKHRTGPRTAPQQSTNRCRVSGAKAKRLLQKPGHRATAGKEKLQGPGSNPKGRRSRTSRLVGQSPTLTSFLLKPSAKLWNYSGQSEEATGRLQQAREGGGGALLTAHGAAGGFHAGVLEDPAQEGEQSSTMDTPQSRDQQVERRENGEDSIRDLCPNYREVESLKRE